MVKIYMDSGRTYDVSDESLGKIKSIMVNPLGVVANYFIDLNNNVTINPSHVSSIEYIEDKRRDYNQDDDDDDDKPNNERGFFG